MRVERGRRAVLRLAVDGSPAHTYRTLGSTTRSKPRTTAGTIIQGRARSRRAGRATVRPQFEQKRLSGLNWAPHAGQNEPVVGRDVVFTLTGYIILAMSGEP